MEPKAALSAIKDFIAPVAPSNAPDPSEGANVVSGEGVASARAASQRAARDAERQAAIEERAEPVDNGPQPGDLRLVIEQDDDSGEYVYKTIDRRTGETLQQFPREEILRLRERAGYASGAVFDGKA